MTHLPGIIAHALRTSLLALLLGVVSASSLAAPTDLNDIPMAVSNQVKANFLMAFDNSQSMDAYMGGALQSGDNPATRSNIGRGVLRGMLSEYRSTFKWGLMSFDAPNPALRYTHVYYMGDSATMVFTDDCVNGVSASNGGRRCVANPQPFAGGNYVTYAISSDDPEVLDALYATVERASVWGISPPGSTSGSTVYQMWFTHVAGSGSAWAPSEFADYWVTGSFLPTDAGYLSAYPGVSRQLYLPRGWGYRSDITGGGRLSVAVRTDSNDQYERLMTKLANESSGNSGEIKNAAIYTPIAGTLASARSYFSGVADWRSRVSYNSPIDAWCQKNFVMLLTDGLPTGDKEGALYSSAARTDSCTAWDGDRCTGGWIFGEAASDAFDAVAALRSTSYKGCTGCSESPDNGEFDIQTYVIAMGDTVANARAVAVMDEMAKRGSCEMTPDDSCKDGDDGVRAFFATSEADLKAAVEAAVINAAARDGAAAAVAVTNANITETTAVYQSRYESGNWTGDLESYPLDVTTGMPKEPRNWSAQKLLDLRSAASRKIASYDGRTSGVRFRPSSAGSSALSVEQEALISATDAAGIIDYLRGDRTGETATSEAAQKYRRRTHLLGDIVNSEPVLLAAPGSNYGETNDLGYAAFKTANAKRQPVVFQGANDGMLHAFNADSGVEEWAYVPSLLLPTLAGLSRVQFFSHKYYVDGTPAVGDVDFSRTAGSDATSRDWRSLLVGGLGKGGYGYYALDVTRTVATDEAAVAAKVLWEFPNDNTSLEVAANVGYSYGRPIIVKTADQGWVVLVSSGYNNTRTVEREGVAKTGDGRGHLFVLNAKTGAVISDIETDSGSATDPSGLASFSAYVDNAAADNTVTQVYAGDLAGNVWRFDLTGAVSEWNVKRLAALVDDADKAQPVTTTPELASIYESNAVYRFVYVGTGQYLGDNDVTTTQTQTMYGLVDDLTSTPTIVAPLRAKLQQQTLSSPFTDPTTGDVRRTASAEKVVLAGGGAKRGWYIDLNVPGERVNTDPQLALGSLVFTSNIPSNTLCEPGGSSYLNILDYRTGGALDATVLAWSSKALGNALASRPVLVRLPSGQLRALIRLSSDKTVAEDVPARDPPPKIRRVSWRELPDKQ